jgi:hypothetical protein
MKKATRLNLAFGTEIDDPEEAGRLANIAANAIREADPDSEFIEFGLLTVYQDDEDGGGEEGAEIPEDLLPPGSRN